MDTVAYFVLDSRFYSIVHIHMKAAQNSCKLNCFIQFGANLPNHISNFHHPAHFSGLEPIQNRLVANAFNGFFPCRATTARPFVSLQRIFCLDRFLSPNFFGSLFQSHLLIIQRTHLSPWNASHHNWNMPPSSRDTPFHTKKYRNFSPACKLFSAVRFFPCWLVF